MMLIKLFDLLTKVEYVDDLKGYRNGYIKYGIPMRIWVEKGAHQDAVLKHELQHRNDAFMTLGLAPLLQDHIPMVKLWMETRAFRHQLEVYGVEGIIESLYRNYALDMERSKIEKYVRNQYGVS